jgi:hypothetical protein
MSWRGLRYKARERLLSREWNAVVDALNDLYGFLTSGQQDIFVDEVYGRTAHFKERIDCEGRSVILDGDPISIYQFYDIAKEQITQAIDSSKVTSNTDLIKEYTRISSDQLYKLDLIADYTRTSRDVLVRVKIDEYGNVGVKIAEPLDVYGRVQVSAPSELLDEFKPISSSGSITATDNTAGFSVILSKGGRTNVNVYYSLGGAGSVYIEASLDGIKWRLLDTVTLSASGSGLKTYSSIAYPFVRARTDATGIDVEFELVASR